MVCLLLFGCGSGAGFSVGSQLEQIVDGQQPVETLTVEYNDLHALHGGLALSIHGDGEVEQEAVRFPAGEPQPLSEEEVRQLVALLLEIEAWRQESPEREALPDESRATLRITVGDEQSEIWEWYNEMESNDRIIRVLREMQDLAWDTGP